MIDTLKIYEELKSEIPPSAAKKIAESIWDVYSELMNTVTKEEFRELKNIVAELSEAQRELAEAQKRTEEELKKLIGEHRKTREQLGGLAHTVGYVLEDRAYKGLPELLFRDFNIKITDSLKRDYIEISPGIYEEVNIIGRGISNGNRILIIGDCKSQLKKGHIDEFLRLIKKLEKVLKEEKIFIAVTYQTSPKVRNYAKEKGIKIYFSYEMAL